MAFKALVKYLEKIRISGNYGHYVNELYRPGANLKKDVPKDYFSLFLQFLFPSGDLTDLALTTRKSDFVTTLKTETIGEIIKIIIGYDSSDENKKKKMVTDLVKLLNVKGVFKNNKKVKNKGFKFTKEDRKKIISNISEDNKDLLKNLHGEIDKKDSFEVFLDSFVFMSLKDIFNKYLKIDKKPTDEQIEIRKKIKELKKEVSNIKKEFIEKNKKEIKNDSNEKEESIAEELLSDNWSNGIFKKQIDGTVKILDKVREKPYYFIGMLVRALDNTYKNSIYPKHCVEQALMALAWLKVEKNPEKIDKILSPLKDFIKKSTLKTQIPKTRENYFLFKKYVENSNKDISIPIGKLLSEKKEFAFFINYGAKVYEQILPEPIQYDTAYATINGKKYYAPNCGSNSFMHFFMAMIFDRKTASFETKHLKENDSLSSGKFNEIIKFFEKYNNPTSMKRDLKGVRDGFAQIVWNLKGVKYLKGNCAEIDAGLKNMLNIIKALAPSLYDNETVEKDAYKILEKFTNAIKRPDLDVVWDKNVNVDLVGENNKGILDLKFKINKKDVIWHFGSGHFSINYEYDEVKWQEDFGNYIYKINGSKNFQSSSSLNLYVNFLDHKIDKIGDENPNNFWKSVWYADLNNDKVLQKAITSYIKLRDKEEFLKKDTVFLKWISKLQLTDGRIKFFLFKEADKHPEILKIKGKITGIEKNLKEFVGSFSEDYSWAKGYTHLLNGLDADASKEVIKTFNENFGKVEDKIKITEAIGKIFAEDMNKFDRTNSLFYIASLELKNASSINSFSTLFTVSMNGENRIDIILAIEKEKDTFKINNFVEGISDNKDILFKQYMNGNEITKIITALIKAGFDDTKIIKSIAGLFTEDMDAFDRESIISALSEANFKNAEVIKSITGLFPEDMDTFYRKRIISVLSEANFKNAEVIKSIAGLFTKGIDSYDREKIISVLSEANFKNAEVIKSIAGLFTKDIDSYNREKIIYALLKGNFKNAEVIKSIAGLFNEDMDAFDRKKIIYALLKGNFKNAEVIKSIAGLFTKDMNERNSEIIINIIESIVGLFTENMNASDRVKIIDALKKGEFKNAEIIKSIVGLFTKNMNASDRVKIIDALVEEEYDDTETINKISNSFKKDMNTEERVKKIEEFFFIR